MEETILPVITSNLLIIKATTFNTITDTATINAFLNMLNNYCITYDLSWRIYPKVIGYLHPQTCRAEKSQAVESQNGNLNWALMDTINDIHAQSFGVSWTTHGRIWWVVNPCDSGNILNTERENWHCQILVSYPGARGSHDLVVYDPGHADRTNDAVDVYRALVVSARDNGKQWCSVEQSSWPRKLLFWRGGIRKLLTSSGWLTGGLLNKRWNNYCSGQLVTGGISNNPVNCQDYCREFLVRFLQSVYDHGNESVCISSLLEKEVWDIDSFIPLRQ